MNDNPYIGPVDQPSLPGSVGATWIRRIFFYGVSAVVIGGLLVALLIPLNRGGREPARRSQCKNNLKQIGLALHNYHDAYGSFPPPYTVDESGQKLHSWRTLLLPFVDQNPLYVQIDLTRPWDDPVNLKLCSTPVPVYLCPSAVIDDADTTYLAMVGPDFAFDRENSRRFDDFTDGASDVLLVLEGTPEQAVPWASPQDADEAMFLGISPESKLTHSGGMNVLFADGAARFFDDATPPEVRRALLTIAGGEKIPEW